ncbi:hypothetical protein ASPZODRAFT_99124 [Penicilliopsis zonata CBS 506.65]|uniref:Glycosyltransferase 2-like domain-containing protein n=1 Tax=Penicilliopsis zonata CBS 506.65 TaxID=1073090 RepID=A0A1L9SDG9_9EURO|nr:hypothetical protein ASPZODRAFT_99124 [Penicilliopsis zonata CBS 506.65]OJJ45246.1 hypothetical protein ASPZODRAFT_99124 [Penicilliopsis zonata CBS 506.65]
MMFAWAVHYTSGAIQEWTPFLLVASYFVFSTCVYMLADTFILGVFWFIYLVTNTYIAATTVLEAFLSLTAVHDSRKAVEKLAAKEWTFPTPDADLPVFDLIIVAYLPNEQDIILSRIHYLLHQIVYPADKLRVNVIYNTPVPIEPVEQTMADLAAKHDNLRVIKVPCSTSKADNINYYCRQVETEADVTAIFDCDHYPHPYGPRWAIERLMDRKVDIVQGRCIILNANENLLTATIALEFDKIYAVSHPGRASMFGFGLFCGSNGYWRTSLLKRLQMDDSMLTEDIDSALRAFGDGANAVHELNAISYELAPVSVSAFWKQRLRWAQGWLQASIRHVRLVWERAPPKPRSLKQRFGILSLLVIREWSYYLLTQYLCLVLSIIFKSFPVTGEEWLRILFFQYPVAWWLFFFSVISLLATLYITVAVRSEFVQWWMMGVFVCSYPLQLVLMAVIGLFGHAREVAKYVKWNPTPRN